MSNRDQVMDPAARYPLDHNFHESVRLYLQHWMWRRTLGYILNPKIPKLGPGSRVADLCCGTGIWLIDLAKETPDARLEGFDLSTAQFPPKEWRPANVSFSQLDVMKPLPEDLVGAFDVIHIGLVVAVVQDDDPLPLLTNVVKMLKPGGYLQWDEADLGGLCRQPSNSTKPTTDLDKLFDMINKTIKKPHVTFGWVRELDVLLPKGGLTCHHNQQYPIERDIQYPWAHMQMMTVAEIIRALPLPPEQERVWRELYAKCISDMLVGVGLPMDMVVAVGQKAGS